MINWILYYFMNIKPLIQNISNFLFDRLVQLIGIVLTFLSIFILLALFTYSAEDPNFVFSNNNEINNIFGFQGSVVSDFLFSNYGTSFIFILNHFIYYRGKCCNKKKISNYSRKFFLYNLVHYFWNSFFGHFLPQLILATC